MIWQHREVNYAASKIQTQEYLKSPHMQHHESYKVTSQITYTMTSQNQQSEITKYMDRNNSKLNMQHQKSIISINLVMQEPIAAIEVIT